MTFDPDTWTMKTAAVFAAAIDQATAKHNPVITSAHILVAICEQEGTLVSPILARLGISPGEVRDRAQAEVDELPQNYNAEPPSLGRELAVAIEAAERFSKDLDDDYLSVEHLLVPLNDRLGVGIEELISVLREVRGSRQVVDRNPEEEDAEPEEGATGGIPRSLDSKHTGTHVDFVSLKITSKVEVAQSPWHYSNTAVDAAGSSESIEAAIAALEAAGRTIVAITPIVNGFAAFLQTKPRETSKLGVTKSEELGYGYGYTGSVMIVSRDLDTCEG